MKKKFWISLEVFAFILCFFPVLNGKFAFAILWIISYGIVYRKKITSHLKKK